MGWGTRLEQAEGVAADAGHARGKTSGGTALCANKTSSGPVSVAHWHTGTVARRSGTVARRGVEIKMSDENLPRCHLAWISIST